MTIRTRFAPSPTGHLHVGGARTAILNWLIARRYGGTFVLRIEDTDVERNVAGAEAELLDELRWLGLEWDEGPGVGGAFGPYRQSERGELYRSRAAWLVERGLAYPCTCPPATTEQANGSPERCPCAQRGKAPVEGTASVRLRVPDAGEIVVDDVVRGRVTFPLASIEDFVLLRSDGRPTYNFAVAVDDAAMRITHVIRGADHLVNTPKQMLLYQAFGEPVPVWAHIPLILGADRQKLSKRHGATSVGEHRREGFLPPALVNYLSLLSWASPSGEEFLPRERLISEVELERVGASDAIFDRDKLRWLNSRYIQELAPEELTAFVTTFIDPERDSFPPETLPKIAAALRNRISVLSEVNRELEHFTGPKTQSQIETREELANDPAALDTLQAVRSALAELPSWTPEEIGAAIREAGRGAGVRGRALFRPVRVAVTGEEHGPDLATVMEVLGRERTLALLAGPADAVGND